MNTHDAIRTTAETSATILKTYLSDLEDTDLLERPSPECNHLAWQLGHLISSECMLLDMIAPGSAVELPEGFAETHSKDNIADNDPASFLSKAEYLEWLDKVHAATIVALEKTSEADLDAPSPEHFQKMFPTVGNMYILLATHAMMHVGQFVPVRRKLGKPILI